MNLPLMPVILPAKTNTIELTRHFGELAPEKVNSPDLVAIRKEIQELYVSRGGDGRLFEANHYYPHITVGFSKQDLHEADGVIKDKNSCIAPVYVTF